MFPTRFDKQDEVHQNLDDIQLYNNLSINQKLTESDIDTFDVRSQLEQQFQNQESKHNDWRFEKTYPKTVQFFITSELKVSSYEKFPIRNSAFLKIENDNKFCFFWLIVANLHPCKYSHPTKFSKYKNFFEEMNIQ